MDGCIVSGNQYEALMQYATKLYGALHAVVDQSDAQRKAGDKLCTVSFGMIDQFREILESHREMSE